LTNTQGENEGVLTLLPSADWVLRQYTGEARVWSTVTPVIWPGHDDGDAAKAEKLLRKAFLNSGIPPELVQTAEFDWRNIGFRAGLDPANQYVKPDHLSGKVSHVRVGFQHPVRGPLAIGAGRYRGFGLMVREK
jgi:CRISPR-associated protein Csb2